MARLKAEAARKAKADAEKVLNYFVLLCSGTVVFFLT